MSCVAKAAALCTGIEEKEKQLEECSEKKNQKTFWNNNDPVSHLQFCLIT